MVTSRYLLAADVGGTKTDIAWGRMAAGRIEILERRVYASGDYRTVEALVDDFCARLQQAGRTVAGAAACFAVAGPVVGDTAKLTNLPWVMHGAALAARYGFCVAGIINDFEAVGHGLLHLQRDELLPLQAGERFERGARVAVGAGTGLGVALLTWCDGRYMVHPTEAGHSDFAPNDELQDDLLAWLRRDLGHVSYERVLSGSGLARVFQFLMEGGHGLPSSALEEAMRTEEAASAISSMGLQGRDALASQALDVFARVYGAYAGNIALTVLPRGGVYIAGGIAPKIAAKLADGRFMDAFLDKGRFRDLLATLPVDIVMNASAGLYGAFEMAERLAAESGAT